MKPRANWTIGEGEANAIRSDGVFAGFLFPEHPKPYAVHRKDGGWLRKWAVDQPRLYKTLELAMIAADENWPL